MTIIRLNMALALWLTLTSCAPVSMLGSKAEPVHIIADTELHDAMQDMADRIAVIALLSVDSNLHIEKKRNRIIPLLDEIQTIASDIDGNGAVTNFSVVNRYMGSFLYDVSLAKQFASQQPPNLVPAERLIKSCLSCHESI